jgi:hypothetical protein
MLPFDFIGMIVVIVLIIVIGLLIFRVLMGNSDWRFDKPPQDEDKDRKKR